MSKSIESYQSNPEEIKKEEEVMTPEQKKQSEFREKVLNKGEYCGHGIEGHLKALELAVKGEGTPARISQTNEWVILREDDFKDFKKITNSEQFNKGQLKDGCYTWDFSEPIYNIYYGNYWRFANPKERNKKYRGSLRELKRDIANIDEMYNFAKTNGEIIKSGGGMSMIKIGKSYIVNKEGKTYVVSEEGYERIYGDTCELVEAIGAEGASEPEEDGQPGTVYWGEGWQGGIGGGVTLVEINGEKYYRQI